MNETYYEAMEAYLMAINNGHTERVQEITCKSLGWAHCYARDVKGADIMRCQISACKEPFMYEYGSGYGY